MLPSGIAVGLCCGKTSNYTTPNGSKVFNFSVACYDSYAKQNVFYNCVAFGKTAEIIRGNYEDKTYIVFEYDLKHDKYKDKSGVERDSYKLLVKTVDMIEWRIKKKLAGYKDQPKRESKNNPVKKKDEEEYEDLPF